MPENKPIYSKLHAVKNGVLVCVDEKKQLFKYVKLDQVMLGSKTLGTALKETDSTIKKLNERIVKLEQFKESQIELNKLNESESDF
jgi:iron-sulfur cluster repair protein YtfE (RIC family)